MLHLKEGEQIDIKARKHWFILVGESLGLFIMAVFPFVIWEMLSGGQFDALFQDGFSFTNVSPALLTFLGSTWVLIIWAKLFAAWTDYYLDIWIVTNNRIVNIDQKGLFRREVSTVSFDRVQDVTFEINGIIGTVLGFGDVYVQTAGETREFVIEGVENPEHVKKRILTQLDAHSTRM